MWATALKGTGSASPANQAPATLCDHSIADSNGNFIANLTGTVSGTSIALESLVTTFHQDLNGDGTIGIPVTQAVNAAPPGAVSSTLTVVNNDNFVFAPAASGNAGDVVSFVARGDTTEPSQFVPVDGHQPHEPGATRRCLHSSPRATDMMIATDGA